THGTRGHAPPRGAARAPPDVPARPRSGRRIRRRPSAQLRRSLVLFFGLSTWALALILAAVIVGATVVGHLVGRSTRGQEHVREPFAVMQAALIGFMGLVLAFGISLAVGRYEARRAAVVDESNAIGTTY